MRTTLKHIGFSHWASGLCLVAFGLSGCGGGGGSTDVKIPIYLTLPSATSTDGQVRELVLNASGTSSGPLIKIPFNSNTQLPATLSLPANQGVNMSIEKHPYKQICKVVNPTSLSTLAVYCIETVVNDTGSSATLLGLDGGFGRDPLAARLTKNTNTVGTRGFDFTKMCITSTSGTRPVEPCASQATTNVGSGLGQWACTRDNVTGLLWRLDETNVDQDLCGVTASTWRRPDVYELSSILDLDQPSNAKVMTIAFPRFGFAPPDKTNAGNTAYQVAIMDTAPSAQCLTAGQSYHLDISTAKLECADTGNIVRVATAQSQPSTQLEWYMIPGNRTFNYLEAYLFLEELNKDTTVNNNLYSDWRIPNYKELASLLPRGFDCVNEEVSASGVNCAFNLALVNRNFWTNTPDPDYRNTASNKIWVFTFLDSTKSATESKYQIQIADLPIPQSLVLVRNKKP